jgi:hypothetical protein
VVYGLALGGIFALAFAFAYGRVARVSPRTTAYGLAAAAFVVVYLVPFLKYPASPPGATDPDTIVKRTLLYATMIAISSARRWRRGGAPALLARFGTAGPNIGAGLRYVVVCGGGAGAPSIREIPATSRRRRCGVPRGVDRHAGA